MMAGIKSEQHAFVLNVREPYSIPKDGNAVSLREPYSGEVFGELIKKNADGRDTVYSQSDWRSPLFFASRLCIATGTAFNRSFGINLPVAVHMPYVPFSIRSNA